MLDLRDITLTSDGDLKLERGDLVEANTVTTLLQDLKMMMKTARFGLALNADFGANLQRFLGYPVNKATAESIRQAVLRQLQKYIRFQQHDISPVVFPIQGRYMGVILHVIPQLASGSDVETLAFKIDPTEGTVEAINV